MDLSSSGSSYDSEEETEIPVSKRTKFLATFQQQSFSLPFDSIIYYILQNPSTPEVYHKLIKSCKYFFIKNPILVVSDYFVDYENGCHSRIGKKFIDFNSTLCKFWIVDNIYIGSPGNDKPSGLSSLISKIYRCDAKNFDSWYQNILFDDFLFLSSKCVDIQLKYSTIMNADDSVVPFEKIIEAVPKLQNMFCFVPKAVASKYITSKTVKEMLKIPHFKNFDDFRLYNIPDSFEIESFFEYIKGNKKTSVGLFFADDYLSEEYKARIQDVVNEIVQEEKHDYKVPWMKFNGIDQSSYQKLLRLC